MPDNNPWEDEAPAGPDLVASGAAVPVPPGDGAAEGSARAARILVVDDDASIRGAYVRMLSREGYDCVTAGDGLEALRLLEQTDVDLIVTDLRMPRMGGLELLEALRRKRRRIATVFITGHADIDQAVTATRMGAYDFLSKPVDQLRLQLAVARALEHHRLVQLNQQLTRRVAHPPTFGNLLGQSPPMLEVFRLIAQVAPTNAHILITGESGTGKEQTARAIHDHSSRQGKGFNIVDCAAIPENLMESILFGHKRGAFTGADQDHAGLLALSDGGTVFFDEIAELPMYLQSRLLRVIQERRFLPVGGDRERSIDVRMLSATNRNLKTEIAQGRFREDLYYRLNVISLHLPPLRERGADILALAHRFLDEFSVQHGETLRFDAEALECLQAHDWPGNVRELRNAIERAVNLTQKTVIGPEDLPESLRALADGPRGPSLVRTQTPGLEDWPAFSQSMKREYVTRLLIAYHGNVTHAMRHAGVSRNTLYRMMEEAGLSPEDFRF